MEIPNILTKTGRFTLIDIPPISDNYRILSSFDQDKLKWFIIGINLSDKLIEYSKNEGFPKIVETINDQYPIIILEDVAKFDDLIASDQSNLPLDKEIIINFIQSIEKVVSITEKIVLNQNLIFLNKSSFQFLGIDIEDDNSPSLIDWICSIITKDISFLYFKDHNKLFLKWEGLIPVEWQNTKINSLNIKAQIRMVKAWLSNNEDSQTKFSDINEIFIASLNKINGFWGQKAFSSVLYLDQSKFTSNDRNLIIEEFSKYSMKILNWLIIEKKLLPDFNWFETISEGIQINKDNFKNMIPVLSYITLFSGKKYDLINIFTNLTKKIEFSDEEKKWLFNPSFNNLMTLNVNDRKIFFYLSILISIDKNEPQRTFDSILIILREFVEDIQNNFRNKILWLFIHKMILLNANPSTINYDEISHYLEDLYLILKNKYEFLSQRQIEIISEYLLRNSNLISSKKVFHAIGGIYDCLIKARNQITLEISYPNLDLLEIFLKREIETSNLTWISLVDKWLEKHPKSKYYNLVLKLKNQL